MAPLVSLEHVETMIATLILAAVIYGILKLILSISKERTNHD